MIRPGLERISLLMKDVPLNWKAIHVAGTNGKGTVCTTISTILNKFNIRTGRFSSPHIIDRWDGISIGERIISKSKFLEAEDLVKLRNERGSINATEFELLTATAFEIFNREHVDIGVVECGMGGRDDATNIIENPLLTVITQLGMDHQQFLGSTEAEIARAKAGIMKLGTDCVVLKPHSEGFETGLVDYAAEHDMGSRLYIVERQRGKPDKTKRKLDQSRRQAAAEISEEVKSLNIRRINRTNALFAAQCVNHIRDELNAMFPHTLGVKPQGPEFWNILEDVVESTQLPGRSQTINSEPLAGTTRRILIDGAHNSDAFNILRKDLSREQHLGRVPPKIVWLLASSQGRKPEDLKVLLNPTDTVVAVEFGPVDGMPWVKPNPTATIVEALASAHQVVDCGFDVAKALKQAALLANEGSLLVVTGSLYLVSDVLRILRDAGCDVGLRSQDDDDDDEIETIKEVQDVKDVENGKSQSAATSRSEPRISKHPSGFKAVRKDRTTEKVVWKQASSPPE